jgi:uncharacterized GH25 family protein
MKRTRKTLIGILATTVAIAVPLAADAHRQWLLPSATVLSGKDPWVTVDAAISNDLFYFEHFPMQLNNLVVTAPDGSPAKAENQSTGRYRSTFDVHLTQPGTYNIAVVNKGLFASYKVNGETKRWRGTPEAFAREVPANAEGLNVTEAQSRIEVFVTAGKPTGGAIKTSGVGLELAPVTHPNDLVAKNAAEFQLLLDGKPASGIKIEIVRGGIRYRDKLGEQEVVADQDGKFSFTWPEAGMYWLEATVTDDRTTMKEAKRRRTTWVATVEVLPE